MGGFLDIAQYGLKMLVSESLGLLQYHYLNVLISDECLLDKLMKGMT